MSNFRFSTPSGQLDIARTEKTLTSYGGFAAFSSFLKRSGIIEKLVETCPIARTSNNATSIRDMVLSILLTTINEGSRFRHVRFIQNDETIKKLFKLDRRICGEDSIRRFLEDIDSESGRKWLDGAMEILFSALPQMFIMDWDSTVTTRYGDQEGVEVGYNPHKPGRGSHHPLICTVAGLRLCLTMDYRSGNVHSADGMISSMKDIVSRLPKDRRPFVARADIGFCSNQILEELESLENMPYYVFKLKKTSRVMEAIRTLTEKDWEGAMSFGSLQIAEKMIQLTTWKSARRVVLGRRLISSQRPEESGTLFGVCSYEYAAFVTDLSSDQYNAWQIVEMYQGRADCENIFDELKNQWGLAGFCSQQQNVTELAARFNLLGYNIWSLFVRFFSTKKHQEGKTSRREILLFPAQLTETGREKTLQIAVADQFWDALKEGYERLAIWLNATATQLTSKSLFLEWNNMAKAILPAVEPKLLTFNCRI